MIPTSYKFPSYDSLPQLSVQKVTEMIKDGGKLVLYDQLLINVKDMNHPGGSIILDPFINNLQVTIKGAFAKYSHSRYAQVLLCLNTIGRLNQSQIQKSRGQTQKLQGKSLFQRVNSYEQYRFHQSALKKIDFSKPIFAQIDQLTIQEKQCLVDIPTMIQNSNKVKFKETLMQQKMYTSDFWLSTICFQIWALIGVIYLFRNNLGNQNLISFLPYFVFGLAKWTLIEYYFHRFLLHQDLKTKLTLDHHLIHHAFPNMRNKLALSISMVAIYMVGFYFTYSFFLGKDQTISILLGVLVGLTLYDITHYYFHFGPDINIPFLIDLKRNHLKHHYRDPNRGFGVSNTISDKIFGTDHLS